MPSYEILGFEYWKPEAWKKFVSDHIVPLNASTSRLLELRRFLLSIVGTEGKVTLSEIEKIRSEILPFLLGGIEEDGKYRINSLAKLVKLAFGIYINPDEFITLEKEKGLKAFDYIKVRSSKTEFLEFLEKLNMITSRIIKIVGLEPIEITEKEIDEIIRNPEKILEDVKTVYVECLNTCANHSYYSFFALSTKNITFKFMKEAYPKLLDNFDHLKSFLGLEKLFEPNVAEKDLREDYSIWTHSEKGLCDCLYSLNREIWYYFIVENVKEVFYFVTTATPNLKDEFLKLVKQKLYEIGWKIPEYVPSHRFCYFYLSSLGPLKMVAMEDMKK